LIPSNSPNIPYGAPTRAELERAEKRVLKAGRSTKADLTRVELTCGPVVVKDFAAKAAWVRAIGRLQIARECRAYRWLGAQAGIPRFFGRIDAHALAVEWIDGDLLDRSPRDRPQLYAELEGIVRRLHEQGLVHLDLRGRQNVLRARDGQVYVLDLAGAAWFRPAGLPQRLFGRLLLQADRAALLKWKLLLDAGPLSDAERSFLRRWGFFRALWVFNRKGARLPEA
jgi:hypothetical protein